MKTYKNSKGLGKKTLALAGVALYTVVLASPIYAGTKPEPLPVGDIKPTLETITTVEQVGSLYRQKIQEYAEDKLLVYDEIYNLDQILERKENFFYSEKMDFNKRSRIIFNEVEELRAKISGYNYSIEGLEREKKYFHPDLEKIKESFDKEVLGHYPSLLEKEANIVYSAETKVKPKLVETLRNMVVKVHDINIEFYKDGSLKVLAAQEDYTLSDLVAFHKALDNIREKAVVYKGICFNEKEINTKKNIVLQKKKILEQELSVITGSEDYKLVSERKSELEDRISRFNITRHSFSKYLDKKKSIDYFKEEYGDFSRYFMPSILLAKKISSKTDYRLNSDEWSFNTGDVSDNIQDYFRANGLEVEVGKLKDPTFTKLPWRNWGWLLSFGFPILRNIFIRTYVGRIKGLEEDGADYWFGVLGGGCQGALGTFWLDGLHPLVWPIRMFGTPLVFQPLIKWLASEPEKKKEE
ncbi:MAG: hypothetical protein KKA79_00350 [Nanoarchaeota archaeon]|nr:hypothetical protein [Nanoarchaeota archaeon]MCG2717979.1 hypothetical protein [Nanoarchaeota archaeon]